MTYFLINSFTILTLIYTTIVHSQDVISPTLSSSISRTFTTHSATGSVTPITTPSINITRPTSSPIPTSAACDAKPCFNRGVCRNIAQSYECACLAGWTGTNCDVRTNNYLVTGELVYVKAGSLTITANASKNVKNLITDTSSSVFRQACASLKSAVFNGLRLVATVTPVGINCVRFYFASLYVEYVVSTRENETTTVQEIQTAIETGLEKAGQVEHRNVKGKNGTVYKFNRVVIISHTTKTGYFNECNTTSGYCDVSAICRDLVIGYRCECTTGYDLVASGSCVKTKSTKRRLFIILPSVFCLLFILWIILVCFYKRRRRRRRDVNSNVNINPAFFDEPYYHPVDAFRPE